MTVAETLRRAKALIDAPEKWTKGEFARNAKGRPCLPREAACFCTVGALVVACGPGQTSAFEKLRAHFTRLVGGSIGTWNDAPERTHAEVMAAFDRAIEIAEGNQ